MNINLLPDHFWDVFKKTKGAFSTPEAIALYNICLQAPKGVYLELGTHRGKSTLAASMALKPSVFYLVDLIFSDKETVKEVGDTLSPYIQEMAFSFLSEYSVDAIKKFDNISYCFVDTGDHEEELVSSEVLLLEDRIAEDGVIAFHDLDNQFVAVRKWYDYLVGTGKYEPIEIKWDEIFNYVRDNNLEDGNDSWHEKGSEEFPKFVGGLKRKK